MGAKRLCTQYDDDDDDDDEVSGSVVVSQGHCVGMVDEFKCGLVAEVTE